MLKLLVSAVVGGLLCLSTASAQQLPTTENATENVWSVMNANSHPKTIQAARSQCDLDADISSVDRLTLEHCVVLEHKLVNNQCLNVEVPDGIGHDYVNGRNSVARNTRKQTGRNDPALLCDVGDGVYIYWYMMDSEDSCNNLAITFAAIKQEDPDFNTEEDEDEPQYEYVEVCTATYVQKQSVITDSYEGAQFSVDICEDLKYSFGGESTATATSGGLSTIDDCVVVKREIEP